MSEIRGRGKHDFTQMILYTSSLSTFCKGVF